MYVLLTKVILCASLLLGMLSDASAAVPVLTPPSKYNHTYKGKLYAQYVDRWGLAFRCGPMAYACSPIGGYMGSCVMTLPAKGTRFLEGTIDTKTLNALIKHERAHCNGWPANHAN